MKCIDWMSNVGKGFLGNQIGLLFNLLMPQLQNLSNEKKERQIEGKKYRKYRQKGRKKKKEREINIKSFMVNVCEC